MNSEKGGVKNRQVQLFSALQKVIDEILANGKLHRIIIIQLVLLNCPKKEKFKLRLKEKAYQH